MTTTNNDVVLQGTVDGSINSRPAAQNTHTLLSDLSDLSSLSSAPEHGAVTAGSAAPQKTQERNENSKVNSLRKSCHSN